MPYGGVVELMGLWAVGGPAVEPDDAWLGRLPSRMSRLGEMSQGQKKGRDFFSDARPRTPIGRTLAKE